MTIPFTSENLNVNTEPKLDTISFWIWLIGSLLGKTWRPTLSINNKFDPLESLGHGNIYVLWHSNILSLSYLFRKSRSTVLISNSKDGMRAAAVAAKWNYEVIYGSSSRQGFTAFRQCLKFLKADKNIVITPDGPKGPRGIVKSGVAHLSKISNAPVIPLAANPDHYWKLNSWDRMVIPKPFSKVTILTGNEVVPEDFIGGEVGIELIKKKIEENLHAITLA